MSYTVLQGKENQLLTPRTLAEFISTSSHENLQEKLANYKQDFLNKVYPIGYIYMSEDSTPPSELFGGEWNQIQEGTTLISSGDATPYNHPERIWLGDAEFELIFSQHLPTETNNLVLADQSQERMFNNNTLNIGYKGNGENYSNLVNIQDYFTQDGKIQLYLMYTDNPWGGGNEPLQGRWIQNWNPLTPIGVASLNHTTLRGFDGYVSTGGTSVNSGPFLDWGSSDGFYGLIQINNSSAFLSGCPSTGNWFYAIGQYSSGHNGTGLLPNTSSRYPYVFLYARVDNLNTNFKTGNYYGASTVTLTKSQLIAHTHTYGRAKNFYDGANDEYDYGAGSASSGYGGTHVGSGAAHNNMQPYIKTYIWERVG